jgi:hypothetical protein
MEAYTVDVETKMKRLYAWLSEKDRRRYAAVEAAKLGHGGVEYIAKLLGCDPKTIRQGLHDLEAEEDPAAERGCRLGGRCEQKEDEIFHVSSFKMSARSACQSCLTFPLKELVGGKFDAVKYMSPYSTSGFLTVSYEQLSSKREPRSLPDKYQTPPLTLFTPKAGCAR